MLKTPCIILLLAVPMQVTAQDKKEPKKAPPAVLVALPLGVKPAITTKVTIRGIKLENTKDIKFAEPGIKVKILNKGPAGVPDKNPQQVGDTQVVAEVTVPDKVGDGGLTFTVVTPDGETKPHRLLVETKLPVLAEKEPNDGFRQAQEIALPAVIEGSIDRPRDVDVFRFTGKARQKVSFEVFAARHGSVLDAVLTIYDSAGNQLARHDDMKDSVDARIELTLPADGVYYVVLMDAHDSGGPVHVYRLVAQALDSR